MLILKRLMRPFGTEKMKENPFWVCLKDAPAGAVVRVTPPASPAGALIFFDDPKDIMDCELYRLKSPVGYIIFLGERWIDEEFDTWMKFLVNDHITWIDVGSLANRSPEIL